MKCRYAEKNIVKSFFKSNENMGETSYMAESIFALIICDLIQQIYEFGSPKIETKANDPWIYLNDKMFIIIPIVIIIIWNPINHQQMK